MFLTSGSSLRVWLLPERAGLVLLAAALFAAGLMAGRASVTASRPSFLPPAAAPAAPSLAIRAGHPAQLVRVVDGDTFEARVNVWPGMEVTTKVRLRGIDAPELSARCEGESAGAQAARDALGKILSQGDIALTQIGQDKYGGRVLASASTRDTADVSAALLNAGLVRSYHGGRRDGWCR